LFELIFFIEFLDAFLFAEAVAVVREAVLRETLEFFVGIEVRDVAVVLLDLEVRAGVLAGAAFFIDLGEVDFALDFLEVFLFDFFSIIVVLKL
jgi:hypothetical protein